MGVKRESHGGILTGLLLLFAEEYDIRSFLGMTESPVELLTLYYNAKYG